jgi:hypothetical protein
MQKDNNTLGDIFWMFGKLSRQLAVDGSMVAALESRWAKLEQPLYVLGCAADPREDSDRAITY